MKQVSRALSSRLVGNCTSVDGKAITGLGVNRRVEGIGWGLMPVRW
jgi:hypothetical protein